VSEDQKKIELWTDASGNYYPSHADLIRRENFPGSFIDDLA